MALITLVYGMFVRTGEICVWACFAGCAVHVEGHGAGSVPSALSGLWPEFDDCSQRRTVSAHVSSRPGMSFGTLGGCCTLGLWSQN